MSYGHKKVSDALTKQQAGHADAPCSAVMELRDKIKRSIHGLQFIERDKRSLYIYRDDCPFVLGWIGYGDYRDGGDGTHMYVVYSRTIENDKYADYRDQHYMKMSVNIDTALKSVKEYIRPYSPVEMARIDMHEVSSAIWALADEVNVKIRKMERSTVGVLSVGDNSQSRLFNAKRSKIKSSTVGVPSVGDNSQSRLFTELKHLLKINHKFVDPSFGAALTDYFRAVEEANQYKGRIVPMWFVHVYERSGSQAFDVVSIDNAENWNPNIGEECNTYNADNLPEEIMGKLSVLIILTDAQYVDGVGYRVGEGMFYVVR